MRVALIGSADFGKATLEAFLFPAQSQKAAGRLRPY